MYNPFRLIFPSPDTVKLNEGFFFERLSERCKVERENCAYGSGLPDLTGATVMFGSTVGL